VALEEQIAEIVDPEMFTRLCNTVFSLRHGEDFQCVDGTRGDEGIDGYLRSEKRIFAFYCPKKPERRTDCDYRAKIRSDIEKARVLRDTQGFPVLGWTFVTPRKLAAAVVRHLQDAGRQSNIDTNHLDSTFLALELAKAPQVLVLFPELQLPRLDEKLDEILRHANASGERKSRPEPRDAEIVQPPSGEKTPDLELVVALRREGHPSAAARAELRSVYYKTSDDFAKINALLGLVEWADPKRFEPDEVAALCDEGILLSQKIGVHEAEARFEAHKGMVLTHKFIGLDIQHRFPAANLAGLPVYSAEGWQEIQDDLKRLETNSQQCFERALKAASETNDVRSAASISLFIGMAAADRAIHLNGIAPGKAAPLLRTCKKAFLVAKDISQSLGDELGVGYALSNLANSIRFFGEEAEALTLAREADEIARRLGDPNLGRITSGLVSKITGCL
jgi:hypothetical protein